MSFLSRIFGGSKEENALKEAFERVRRLLEDELYQVELLNPMMKGIIAAASAYDCDPNGSGPFGFTESNPIPVNGPIGELAYLSKLETLQGERILFHRIGAITTIDVFEAVTFTGNQWFIFFLDFYHPRKSRLAPEGFRFTQEVAQFSGFHRFCKEFPYDFIQMKHSERESGLSMAYIPIAKVEQQIQNGIYQRPLAHKVKLELVTSRLTSTQTE